MLHPYLSSSLFQWLSLWGVCISFLACANPIPPTGGAKDTEPPKLITEESTPNFLTGFDRDEIILTFDEWIQLKDQNLQIVISPPLMHRPEITLKGKSIIIKFHEDEILRERTTYLVNFGSAIADINEGNLLDQYKYVFSTGTFIDSLQMRGSVVNSATGEPAKQVLIILHDNLSDTAITDLLPAYFAKSNDTGQWTIENVRGDTFNVFALTDLNLNYRYDQVGEQIGFLGRSVVLPDTSVIPYRMILFAEDPVLSVLDIDRRTAGITKMTLTGKSKFLSVTSLDTTRIEPLWGIEQDTLLIWNQTQDSFAIVLSDGSRVIDTVRVYGSSEISSEQNIYTALKRFLHPAEALIINSKVPVDSMNLSGITCLLSDSIAIDILDARIDSTNNRQILIRHPWVEQERYRLTLLPGTIVDIFGITNDTVKVNFQISPRNSYGQIMASINGLNDTVQYIVQLLDQQSGILSERIVQHQTTAKVAFDKLQPQTYKIRIIEDANANEHWDTGNLAQQRQPERVFIQTLEPLRAGWDLEALLIWEQQ